MKQLPLFDLPEDFNRVPKLIPLYDPSLMDALADVGSMGWRDEIIKRNFEIKYKTTGYETG
jgi:hypothetical protein